MSARTLLGASLALLVICVSLAYFASSPGDSVAPADALAQGSAEEFETAAARPPRPEVRAEAEHTSSHASSDASPPSIDAAETHENQRAASGTALLYGRIEVLATGLLEAPRITELVFVDARGARHEAELHSGARYTCGGCVAGRAYASVSFPSGAIADVDVEIPPANGEQRLDLHVRAPYHVAIPVFLVTPDGQRFRSAAHTPEQPWPPQIGIEWLGLWIAVADEELPERLARSGVGPDSREIGRWTYHTHLKVPKDADGTLELLRWAPTTHVALYREDHRLANAQFQHPPERLELVVDPSPFLRERPATVRIRCVDAQDLAPLSNTLLSIAVDGEPGQRLRPLQDGHVSLVNLRPGRRSLTLRPNRRAARRIDLELASGEERDLGDLLFERGRSLRLRVRDDAGAAWSGVALVVRADEAQLASARGVKLDAEGCAEIDGLDAARTLIWLAESAGDPIVVHALVDLTEGPANELVLRWPSTRHPLTVSARLEPWEHGVVELSDGAGETLQRLQVNGAREIDLVLPAGTHHLRLLDPRGREVEARELVLPKSDTHPIRLARRAR